MSDSRNQNSNDVFVPTGRFVDNTPVTQDPPRSLDLTPGSIQEARQKQVAEFEQAAEGFAVSRDANPLFGRTAVEAKHRAEVARPSIEVDFILSNGAKIEESREQFLTEKEPIIQELRNRAKLMGRRVSRIDRVKNELIDREAVTAAKIFKDRNGNSLIPEGQSWRFSFQDGEWIWERFMGNDKEPYAVTRYTPTDDYQTVKATEYHRGREGAVVADLEKSELWSLGVWTYEAANLVRDKEYLKPQSRGGHLFLKALSNILPIDKV